MNFDGEPKSLSEIAEPMHSFIEQLYKYRDHPALHWHESFSNGVFEGDSAKLPAPGLFYRFVRGRRSAWIWAEQGRWCVRPWRPIRGSVSHKVVEVADLKDGLDYLCKLPWWRFW